MGQPNTLPTSQRRWAGAVAACREWRLFGSYYIAAVSWVLHKGQLISKTYSPLSLYDFASFFSNSKTVPHLWQPNWYTFSTGNLPWIKIFIKISFCLFFNQFRRCYAPRIVLPWVFTQYKRVARQYSGSSSTTPKLLLLVLVKDLSKSPNGSLRSSTSLSIL